MSLDGEWHFRGFLGDEWRWARLGEPHLDWLTGHVPGCVVDDLWRAGEVPDPYAERNSRFSEWAATRTWAYQRSFVADPAWRGRRVQLCFGAIDHDARVFLNGRRIARHRGGFTSATFEVGDRLRHDEPNLLAVLIAPAPDEQPQVGDTRRVRHHLSRMTYGWDFSPRMPHQGIWRPVELRVTGDVRIEELFVRARSGEPVRVSFDIDAREVADLDVDLEIIAAATNGAMIEHVALAVQPGRTPVERTVDVDLPLWWANGMGDQPLHRLRVSVRTNGETSDEAETTFGVRAIELRPNAGAEPDALPYTFVVNGRRIYVNGWNWVPLDVLYGPPRPQKLEHLLRLAHRANVNLLRVWGGGLIESDAFYDGCDELGIMVWQEFAQSSSSIVNRPSRAPGFVRLMEEEARAIIPRLRNHPSLAVWGGGNELTDLDGRPLDDREPVLGALHSVVWEMDQDRAWLPTSPTGREGNNSLEAIRRDPAGLHDVHGPWEHQGLGHHEELYDAGTALFHSEFGVEGMANLETLEATIEPEHRWPAGRSNPVYAHRGAWWNNEPLVQTIFGGIDDLPTLVRASQYLQASGLRYAVEANRRRQWRSSGVVPWQLNEPFPNAWCTSAVGYDGRPKPAYFAVADAYEPIHLSARFASQAAPDGIDATLFGSNATDAPVTGTLAIAWFAADGTRMGPMQQPVVLPASSSVELGSVAMRSNAPIAGNLLVLDLRLGDVAASRYLFSTTDDLAPMRSLPETRLDVGRVAVGADAWDVSLRNAGEWLAMLVRIEDARPYGAAGWAVPSDDSLLLLPSEERVVRVDWEGVAEPDRCLRIGAWNTEAMTLA